ncbi:hypothetical protein LUR56_39740 [Streptomyces sp. MT29]|nr:hypothetical protein [Streptomyces sp. MT29]
MLDVFGHRLMCRVLEPELVDHGLQQRLGEWLAGCGVGDVVQREEQRELPRIGEAPALLNERLDGRDVV